jgi:hypothetical protein
VFYNRFDDDIIKNRGYSKSVQDAFVGDHHKNKGGSV